MPELRYWEFLGWKSNAKQKHTGCKKCEANQKH